MSIEKSKIHMTVFSILHNTLETWIFLLNDFLSQKKFRDGKNYSIKATPLKITRKMSEKACSENSFNLSSCVQHSLQYSPVAECNGEMWVRS